MTLDPPATYACSSCGREVDPWLYAEDTPARRMMAAERLCHGCAWWRALAEDPPGDAYMVDGCLTEISSTDDPLRRTTNAPRGRRDQAGKGEYHAVTESLGTVTANHIHKIGTPTPEAAPAFPVRAILTGSRLPTKIEKMRGYSCARRGCLDRYRCAWYDPGTAEPDGPWNEVPEGYKIGGEHCPSFIDRHLWKK